MDSTTSRSEFLTVADASKRLGIAQNTLRSWGALGKIEEYRHPINNYRLYKLADVEALARLLEFPVRASNGRQAPSSINSSHSS